MNKVLITGRLTKDPEMRQVGSSDFSTLATFTVAVQRDFKNKETGQYDADFIYCKAWRQTAEFISQYFKKGDIIEIEGNWRHDSWQDDSGDWQNSDYVNVQNVGFGLSKKESTSEPHSAFSAESYGAFVAGGTNQAKKELKGAALDEQLGLGDFDDTQLPFDL